MKDASHNCHDTKYGTIINNACNAGNILYLTEGAPPSTVFFSFVSKTYMVVSVGAKVVHQIIAKSLFFGREN